MAAIPAWRRIGLKLSSESDSSRAAHSAPSLAASNDIKTVQKRKLEEGTPETNVPIANSQAFSIKPFVKKRKTSQNITTSKNVPLQEPRTVNTNSVPAKADQSVSKPKAKVKAKSKTPTKTVSFATDTKDTDSDASLIASAQKAAKAKPPPSEASLKAKQAKREKRAQRRAQTAQPDQASHPVEDRPTKPYLVYLQQHHTGRDKWKFNKSNQNQLLKYIFDLFKVPPSLDTAVHDYIAGLQGEGARQRLREDADKILAEPLPEIPPESLPTADNETSGQIDTMNPSTQRQCPNDDPSKEETAILRLLEAKPEEDPDDQQRLQDKALARKEDTVIVKRAIKEGFKHAEEVAYAQRFPKLLAKRKRAELVLEALRQQQPARPAQSLRPSAFPSPAQTQPPRRVAFPELVSKPQPPINGVTSDVNGDDAGPPKKRSRGRKRSRRRKRRTLTTGVPDDDEISSSSPSSSSSSSSSSSDSDFGDEQSGVEEYESSDVASASGSGSGGAEGSDVDEASDLDEGSDDSEEGSDTDGPHAR